jgi:hypothetical protein
VGGSSLKGAMTTTTLRYDWHHSNGEVTSRESGILREARQSHACGIISLSIGQQAAVVVGGIGIDADLKALPLVSTEVYYFGVEEWTLIEPLKSSRSSASMVVVNYNRLLLLGGTSNGLPQNDVFLYNSQTGWHKASFSMPMARDGHTTLILKKKNLFLFGTMITILLHA